MSQSQGKHSEGRSVPFLHNISSGRKLTCTVQLKSGSHTKPDREGSVESSCRSLQKASLNTLGPATLWWISVVLFCGNISTLHIIPEYLLGQRQDLKYFVCTINTSRGGKKSQFCATGLQQALHKTKILAKKKKKSGSSLLILPLFHSIQKC